MKDCKLLEYAGYYGSIEVSVEDKCLCGSVQFIRDLISYSGNSFEELENSFHEAVDQYLAFCEEIGKAPSITCSGTFNVRVGTDLHTKAVLSAKKSGMTLNEFVKSAVQEKVDGRNVEQHSHLYTPSFVSEGREP
jgi:predicted HicB family RNase H-like nuclease